VPLDGVHEPLHVAQLPLDTFGVKLRHRGVAGSSVRTAGCAQQLRTDCNCLGPPVVRGRPAD
jgi:hypothetical protein